MATQLIQPRFQLIYDDIAAAGYKLFTYSNGTTTPKTTWKNQDKSTQNTNPIVLDAQGMADIWLDGSYTFVIATPDATTPPALAQIIYTIDAIIGYDARDWTGLTASIADLNSTTTTALVKTTNYPITLTDRGKTLLVNATSGTVTISLLSAVSAANGYAITIKKTDYSTNGVVIDANAAETIDSQITQTLWDYNDFITILCDGSNWQIISSQIRGSIKYITTTTSIDLSDNKKLIEADAVGGAIIVNLPSAVTVGRGFSVTVKKIDATTSAVTLTPAGAETIDGSSSLIINTQYSTSTIISNGVNWDVVSEFGVSNTIALPTGYLTGLLISNNAVAPTTEVDVSVGKARGNGDDGNLILTAIMTKILGASWVQGSGNGGSPAAILPLQFDTWYHVFVIGKTDGTTDVGFDTSITATNLLAFATGYTLYRRIGAVQTGLASTNIKAFYAREKIGGGNREFWWDTPLVDFTDANPAAAAVLKAMNVPNGIRTRGLFLFMSADNGAADIYFSSPDTDDIDPTTISQISLASDGAGNYIGRAQIELMSNTSRQIRYRPSTATIADVTGTTLGWSE